MLILASDMTNEMGGVGIFRDAECLASVANEGATNRFSVTLFEMVEQALAQARLELREIELFASANGPGSFTGIRTGLAAAGAWGKAFGRTVRGVSVLEAMVYKARREADWIFPILDARRAEFYLGSFLRTTPQAPVGKAGGPGLDAAPTTLQGGAARPGPEGLSSGWDYEAADEGWVLNPEALKALLQERTANGESASCLVRAHDQIAGNLRASLPASLDWQSIPGSLLDSIAAIAGRDEKLNRPCSGADLETYYIRRPDAESKRIGD